MISARVLRIETNPEGCLLELVANEQRFWVPSSEVPGKPGDLVLLDLVNANAETAPFAVSENGASERTNWALPLACPAGVAVAGNYEACMARAGHDGPHLAQVRTTRETLLVPTPVAWWS